MGSSPKSSRPSVRRANIVSFEEAKRGASARPSVGSTHSGRLSGRLRKDFVIERGELREGALFDPSKSFAEDEGAAVKKPRRAKVADTKSAKRAEAKRARTKARANKKFDKMYGDSESRRFSVKSKKTSNQTTEDGPRPALYKGKLGASQKKSSKMQARASKMGNVLGGLSLPTLNLPKLSAKIGATILTVCIIAVSAFALYGPAQQYYTQMRETDRLQAEYAAVAARTDALQTSIDALQTDAGIEDKAHADLGYVKQGEQTGTVKGITFNESHKFASNVVPGSIPAPDTWYSPFLDIIFNYKN